MPKVPCPRAGEVCCITANLTEAPCETSVGGACVVQSNLACFAGNNIGGRPWCFNDRVCCLPTGMRCGHDELLCGGQCSDVENDPRNCGACFHACRPGETCVNRGCRDGRGARFRQ